MVKNRAVFDAKNSSDNEKKSDAINKMLAYMTNLDANFDFLTSSTVLFACKIC